MILVVDDNDIVLEMIKAILKEEGYLFDVAGDSETAISKANKVKCRLILLDLLMPGKNGLEIAQAIRGGGESQSAYIVALTGALLQTSAKEVRDSGINEVVMKPIGYRQLKDLVSKYLGG